MNCFVLPSIAESLQTYKNGAFLCGFQCGNDCYVTHSVPIETKEIKKFFEGVLNCLCGNLCVVGVFAQTAHRCDEIIECFKEQSINFNH